MRELVEKRKLPVASSLMGLGAFPATHSPRRWGCWGCLAFL
ncbi:hypothetical protein MJK72_05125 [Klebsiella pneumoniae]|nr:hypothetical protein MJK72_05125 [Klebsiella pneumoniae]